MSDLDPSQQPAAWPVVPFQRIMPFPVPTGFSIEPHPSGSVQIVMSTPSGHLIGWLDKDDAKKIANDLYNASTGLRIVNGHVPPTSRTNGG